MASSSRGPVHVEVGGHELKLTSLDRVVYPKTGFTKRDVLAYYSEVARVMLPHLKGRAVEVRRYPENVEEGGHWLRDLPPGRPSWMQAARVYAETRQGEIEYPHVVDEASLLWCANQNMLEFHTFLAPFDKPREPTTLVFDLDPGAGRDAADCADVALILRDTLEAEDLRVFPKTSGGKGLQLFVPLNGAQRGMTFARTKAFARELAEAFEHLRPDLVTAKVAKEKRAGKVLIDWGQNERNHLMVAPYSLRARDAPLVSAPLEWREVEQLASERDLALARVHAWEALARVEDDGDLFADVRKLRQKLPDLGGADPP